MNHIHLHSYTTSQYPYTTMCFPSTFIGLALVIGYLLSYSILTPKKQQYNFPALETASPQGTVSCY